MLSNHESLRTIVGNLLRPAEKIQEKASLLSEDAVVFRAAFLAPSVQEVTRLPVSEDVTERKKAFWEKAKFAPNLQTLTNLALSYRHPDFRSLRVILTAMYDAGEKWWKSLGLTEAQKWESIEDPDLREKAQQIEAASFLEVVRDVQKKLLKIRQREYVGEKGIMELASELEGIGWYVFTTKKGPLSGQKVSEVILGEWMGTGILEAEGSISTYLTKKGVPEEYGLLQKVVPIFEKDHHCVKKLHHLFSGQFVDHEEFLGILDYFGERYTLKNRHDEKMSAKRLASVIRKAWKNINFAEVRPYAIDTYLEKEGVIKIPEIFATVLEFFNHHPALLDLLKINEAKTLGQALRLLNRISTNFREPVGNKVMTGWAMAHEIENIFCEILDEKIDLSIENTGSFEKFLAERGISSKYGIRRKIFFLFYVEIKKIFEEAKESHSSSSPDSTTQ